MLRDSLQVAITCQDGDDTPCDELESPPGQCSLGAELSTIRLQYTGESCAESSNRQGDDGACVDVDDGIPADEEVRITCSDGGTVLAEKDVIVGGAITVSGENDGALPTVLECVVTNIDGSTTYQEVTVNTSGEVDLSLKDTFGSLQVESCDDSDCITTVTYSYTMTNIGTTSMTITVLERERNGDTSDFIDSVDPKELAVGQLSIVTEEDDVDLCADNTITTTVTAEADPPQGATCKDTDDYVLTTTSPTESPTPPSEPRRL